MADEEIVRAIRKNIGVIPLDNIDTIAQFVQGPGHLLGFAHEAQFAVSLPGRQE